MPMLLHAHSMLTATRVGASCCCVGGSSVCLRWCCLWWPAVVHAVVVVLVVGVVGARSFVFGARSLVLEAWLHEAWRAAEAGNYPAFVP